MLPQCPQTHLTNIQLCTSNPTYTHLFTPHIIIPFPKSKLTTSIFQSHTTNTHTTTQILTRVTPIHYITHFNPKASNNLYSESEGVSSFIPKMATQKQQERQVICIGDIHGYYTKLGNLWNNLLSHFQENPSQFNNALVIFVGDYCDRGPDTKKVIDFLLSLPKDYPNQTHVFLAGNHDFAFAAFLGVVPVPKNGFREGWREYEGSEEREGWYKGVGWEEMHLQGRRWGGFIKVKFNSVKGVDYQGSIYDAAPTFESYGVPHGSSDLMNAVPDDHKKFLADLVWVHEEENVAVETSEGLKQCTLIAVHGGLQQGKPVNEQLKLLKARDTSISKVECLSGRKTILDMHEDLKSTQTIVVSGHHGKLHIDGLRLIIDEGGGYKDKPIAAIILPSKHIVRDTDLNK